MYQTNIVNSGLESYELCLRLLSNNYRILTSSSIIFSYRRHNKSASQTRESDITKNGHVINEEYMLGKYKRKLTSPVSNIMKNNIIVAHPDDETLGCGGLISKLVREQKNIFVLIVAEGSSCRFSTSATKQERDIQKLAIKKRSKMLERSMHYLGVQDI